jgi:hypothetical protein
VGELVVKMVGVDVGRAEGAVVGLLVGDAEGAFVGADEGEVVGASVDSMQSSLKASESSSVVNTCLGRTPNSCQGLLSILQRPESYELSLPLPTPTDKRKTLKSSSRFSSLSKDFAISVS